jgi:hypothetical protein
MKVAIMQPYFFPYIGYFQLIKHADLFIIFDDSQYIRHGWINRNRILKPEKDWQYVIAPLQEHEKTALIKDIKVQNGDYWKMKILRQIEHYKKKSPFYKQTKAILEECFNHPEISIAHLNAFYLQKVCSYINLPLNLKISSAENYDYSNVNDAGEWALRICEQIGGKYYLNPIGGKELFDPMKFNQSNIELNLLSSGDISYSQRRNGIIESGLSIIDVMMFNSPEEIQNLLNQCQIQTAQ